MIRNAVTKYDKNRPQRPPPSWWAKAVKLKDGGMSLFEVAAAVGHRADVTKEAIREFRHRESAAKQAATPAYIDEAEVIRLHRKGLGHTAIAAVTRAPYARINAVLEGART